MASLDEVHNQHIEAENDWLDKEAVDSEVEGEAYPIDEYDLVSTPNDFNILTLVNFIDSEVVIIPGFQRNFVWDIKKASRLIESIIVGLPVPQIFLYEQAKNRYLVIDGQQRLMSIYFFVKGRFPRKAKLAELRMQGDGKGAISQNLMANDQFFTDFRLNLPERTRDRSNRFHGQDLSSLEDDHRQSLELRTIRNVIVRQVQPAGHHAMYEIFDRLNSGGINLTSQEIRRCTFDSSFYGMLDEMNGQQQWRNLVGKPTPDLHLRDVEILLRGFAMLVSEAAYRPSMIKFLNEFSLNAKSFDANEIKQLRDLLISFLDSCQNLPHQVFQNANGSFSPTIFESVFVAVCSEPFSRRRNVSGKINLSSVNRLKEDDEFRSATQNQTTGQSNVHKRLELARSILELD